VAHHHFEPESYPDRVRSKVPQYDELEDTLAGATEELAITRILDLGAGTGETARRVLAKHPRARVVLVDASTEMLEAARLALPEARVEQIIVRQLEDPLPDGPFDLVVSALAVHHLGSPDKQVLFQRIAELLRPGGRFVLADVIVPEDPSWVVSPLDSPYDRPDRLDDQLRWLEEAGLKPHLVWASGDLAVVRADRPLEQSNPSEE
jgi:tRNA (cmo5U34)-methyltransferase